MADIFEIAARKKFRFGTAVGQLNVENLFDLPLVNGRNGLDLDTIAKTVYKELNQSENQVSFVEKAADSKSDDLQVKLDILKHVIAVKQAEAQATQESVARAERKQFLAGLLAKKQEQKLNDLSEDEIKAEIAKLG